MFLNEFLEEEDEQATWGAVSFLIAKVERCGLHERLQDELTNELTEGVNWERWHEINSQVDDALPPEWANFKGEQKTIQKLFNAIL